MVHGMGMAASEITLVLFTTFAPSGVVAFLLMGIPAFSRNADAAARVRIRQYLCIPLVVSLSGLVMSATHLGNPSNVLYVFSRVGASPLSNEVAAAAAFLALSGVYWLYSFSRSSRERLHVVWFALIAVSAAAFVACIALAYSADTVITWDTPFVPIGLWFSAFAGGPLLALLGLRMADADAASGAYARALLMLSAAALLGGVACGVVQNLALGGVSNALFDAADFMPFYGVSIAAFAVLGSAGIGCAAWGARRFGGKALACCAVSCLLMFAGLFAMRASFYAMHLTL